MLGFLGRQGRPWWFVGSGLALLAVFCATGSIRAATNLPIQRPPAWSEEDPADQAITRAIAYLYSQQHDGTWEIPSSQPGALTALSTYALLTVGQSSLDERLKPAIAFLSTAELRDPDAVGLRCQVWGILPPSPEVRIAAGRDATWLERALHSDGATASHYGLLGLWACGRVGISVPPCYWQQVEEPLRPQPRQMDVWPCAWPVGGQALLPEVASAAPDLASTRAAVAALLMSREFLHASDGLDCIGNIHDPQLDAGLRRLADHARELFDPPPPDADAFWAAARIASAGGRRCFGNVDWYQRGAAELLARQDARDGSWGSVSETALAMLFLAQGRAPVAIAKLDYGITPHDGSPQGSPKAGNWNQRPLDVANATAWISHRLRRPLNWRIVRLGDSPDDGYDLLSSGPDQPPVLYLAGNQTLEFTDAELARLRAYALGGGLILAHADMASSMFAESFRAMGEKLFPQYTFRPLPVDHPIFTQGPFAASAWRHPIPIEGLSNGCRELMVLLPQGDPARYWQTQWAPRGLGAGDPVRSQEAAEMAADLVAYAADPSTLPNQRLARPALADSSDKIAYSLSVARLRYDGNWDPEPAGWPRLVATLRTRQQVDLHVETIELGVGKLPGYKVAHLTGTGHFHLSEAAHEELRKFVNTGGVLIVESAGGSADFTTSAETELESTFGEKIPSTPLSLLHPVFSVGQRIDSVNYRPAAARILGDLHAPRLRGLDAAGRTVVFFSPEDLSVGLTGAGADGIVGYDPACATSIMGNMLLYAADK